MVLSLIHIYLAVEPHPARATLGTRAAGVTAAEELVARDQCGGYLTCVRLYLLAEGVVGQFPALDTRQLLFPDVYKRQTMARPTRLQRI